MKKCLLLLSALILLAAAPAHAGPQDFTLVNGSASLLCYVYISPSNSSDWEEDVLGADQCLEPGESIDIAFDAGSQAKWDLRVEDDKKNYEDYRGFNLMQISRITIQGGGKATYQ